MAYPGSYVCDVMLASLYVLAGYRCPKYYLTPAVTYVYDVMLARARLCVLASYKIIMT